MNSLKAPSLTSLLESDRASNDTDFNIQLDLEELDDTEYSLPAVDTLPTLESVLHDLDSELDSDSFRGISAPTPTPSIDDASRIGSMLRHATLHGVSNQISSAADRVNAGMASAITVDQMIVVGTSHGHILCFDSAQVLRWCCQEFISQGAVSTLSLNDDNSRLLVGFARGLIVMIDTTSGDPIRTLTDAITPNTAVLSIKWTERPALALCLDSGGSVWSLSFTRRLGIRSCNSRCLFSGARGEVCTIEPLIINDDLHMLKAYSIVALATLSKFFIVAVKPRLQVLKVHSVSGPADSLPLIAWQMVLIQAADSSRTVDPVLAAARGNQLFFHQVCYTSGKINILFLRYINLNYGLLSIHWLGSKTLATCDRSEMLHLIDVRTTKELESYDMVKAGLVYNSAQYKALATGGNVSPALALAGTFACYNSIVALENQLYILGSRCVHIVSVRPWSDRISHLSSNHKWAEAVELALEGFRGAKERPRREEIAKNRILQLIEEYMAATSQTPECSLDPIMRCIIEIGETKLLWEELWDRLNNTDYFLSLLTEHIDNGRITNVSTCVAQSLCEYWEKISIQKLEEILLKLDWQCLDLHQVLTMAKTEKMYRVQMHLNTKALRDYAVSLTDLVPLIPTSENANLGNYILVYISSCLAGRGYPTGNVEEDLVMTVKHEVLRCLTVVHSNMASEDESTYPYLRILLNFDTRETLNVISLAFQEREFSGDLGFLHRQRIINILLEIFTPEKATWSQIGCLMNFVANQIANKCLPEDTTLLAKVMAYLSSPDVTDETAREHSDRESAWLELLNTDLLQYIPNHELVRMARAAKCSRVVEFLLEKSQNYDEILDCYLQDNLRHFEMFSYLSRYAMFPEREILSQITQNIRKLFHINPDELTKVVIENFSEEIPKFIRLLEKNPEDLYGFMDRINSYGVLFSSDDCELFIELMCQFQPQNVEPFLKNPNNKFRIDFALNVTKKFNLNSACVLLYEKQGDYQSAFNVSIELLKEAPESLAEASAIQISSLCVRASDILTEKEREHLWFSLLQVILSRPDLTSITKSILHMASSHVDLNKLVQLVLTSGTKTGNFGDIRHLIVGMLSNSKYESVLLETTARILGSDLHDMLVLEKRSAARGLVIPSIKCADCGHLLRNIGSTVIVFGTCGHAVHQDCYSSMQGDPNSVSCPKCYSKCCTDNSVRLSSPKVPIFEDNSEKSDQLQLSAPPRVGL